MRQPLSAAIVFVVSLSLSACAVGPEYAPPPADTPSDWQQAANEQLSSAAAVDAEWWKRFDDPALDAVVERARSENLSLRVAGLRILESRAILGVAEGQRWPQQQQVNATVNRVAVSENAPNAALGDQDFTDAQVTFDLTWELDFWGRFRRGIESAEALLEADLANFADAIVLLTAETADTYITIRLLEERLRLASANETTQTRALEIATVLFDNGATTELDVTQAKTTVARTARPRTVSSGRKLH